jgi:hypothetical protein
VTVTTDLPQPVSNVIVFALVETVRLGEETLICPARSAAKVIRSR